MLGVLPLAEREHKGVLIDMRALVDNSINVMLQVCLLARKQSLSKKVHHHVRSSRVKVVFTFFYHAPNLP